jgi:hypothetical protein
VRLSRGFRSYIALGTRRPFFQDWPRGGVVTQRTANPCTPVRFRPWPPPLNTYSTMKKITARAVSRVISCPACCEMFSLFSNGFQNLSATPRDMAHIHVSPMTASKAACVDQSCADLSAYVGDALLGNCLVGGFWRRRQLKHRCLLTLT